MPKLKPYKGMEGVYLWHYVPSKPASIVFMLGFFVATGFISYRMVRTRTWFSIPFVIGGLMEALGYAARAVSAEQTDKLAPFAAQLLLILIAPALLAATIYMALSRLMRTLQAEAYSIVSARWLTRLFVFGDVLSFLIQIGGGAIASNPDGNHELAKWMILIGLLVQIVFFGLFIVTAIIFHRRMSRYQRVAGIDVNWAAIMTMLYVVSGLVMVRSIFRVIEYAMGTDSYLFKHEWPLYVFDGVLMLVATIIWGVFYPGNLNVARQAQAKVPAQEGIPMYVRMEEGQTNERPYPASTETGHYNNYQQPYSEAR